VELLVILFFFGLSAGTVAKIKGGPFLIWFVVGFCIPFIGTIGALAYPRKAPEDKLVRRCEECNAIVPIMNQVCTRCGRDLGWPDEVLRPRPAGAVRAGPDEERW